MEIKMTGIDTLAKSIEAHDLKVKRIIGGQFGRAKAEAVNFAKLNAPWTDQTGNARSGLFADVGAENNGDQFWLILAHSVYYGIFLESRFSGRYAIIMPTINYIGQLLIERIAQSISRMEAEL